MKTPFVTKDQVEKIVQTYPTPFHIYDEKGIRKTARDFRKAFAWNPGFKEYFAVKATPNPTILRILHEEGCGTDCSSMAELIMSERVGITGTEIMFSSNDTPDQEFLKAYVLGATINLDDISLIDDLKRVTGTIPKRISCRFNPGGKFAISNAIMDNPGDAKYGMTEDQIIEAYRRLKAMGAEEFGIHAFLASNTVSNEYYPVLAGILFSEEDRSSLEEVMKQLFRNSVILGLAVGAILVVFAPVFVGLFVPQAGAVQTMAVLGVRLFAAGLIPCCINSALKNAYQVMGRELLTEGISLFGGAIFPALAAFVLSRFLGTTGIWFYFVAGQLITLLAICLYIRYHTKMLPWENGAFLLLKDDFIVPKENVLEADIHTLQDMAAVVRETESFCLAHGESAKISNRIALCVEEMAGNAILHGFEKDKKPHHLSVRVLCKENGWVVRFRDDCRAFDPVHYIPREGKDALGIRLTLAMAEEAHYIYSLNLNNLTLKLPTEKAR